MAMTREEKMELIQRMLGIRHKLKVHDSMKSPETHEELSISLLSRWELEDELRAIEGMIEDERRENVQLKQKQIEETYLSGKPLKKKK
jgi:hypothetical protein